MCPVRFLLMVSLLVGPFLSLSQNVFFDLRTSDPIYSEGAIEDLEGVSMTLTLNEISTTLTASDGVLNQTISGFGVNASGSGDDTDQLDNGSGLDESISISFDVQAPI